MPGNYKCPRNTNCREPLAVTIIHKMIGFINTEIKKAYCKSFKNTTSVELNQVM